MALNAGQIVTVKLPSTYPGNVFSPVGWIRASKGGETGLVPASHLLYFGESSPTPQTSKFLCLFLNPFSCLILWREFLDKFDLHG